jgi:hypothetical protein
VSYETPCRLIDGTFFIRCDLLSLHVSIQQPRPEFNPVNTELRERIHQIEARALRKVRHLSRSLKWRDYLE